MGKNSVHMSMKVSYYCLKFLETKNWLDVVWAPCEKQNMFFKFFSFWTSELHNSQAFRQHQARLIPTPYDPMVNFYSKRVVSSFFLYFLKSSYMQPCGWNCPRVEGQGAKMMLFSMWPLWFECEVFELFFKKFYGFYSVEVLSQDPHQQKRKLAHSYLQI